MIAEQLDRVATGTGFIAALDQSGGSTPKALAAYGVAQDAYSSPEEMFDLVHDFRVRIATSPVFDSRILGAILFEGTMRREIAGLPAAEYLWTQKNIVPFVKIDKGLEERDQDVQLLKPMPELGALLEEANRYPVFGTKERSVIHEANSAGIDAVVAQQFEVGETVLGAGLVPIIEPEVSIVSETKAEAEDLLLASLTTSLDAVSAPVMLKLTLPETDGLYSPLLNHPKVLRIVALSGGYSLEESVRRLALNPGVIASFSRALTDRLRFQMSAAEFDEALNTAIDAIATASLT